MIIAKKNDQGTYAALTQGATFYLEVDIEYTIIDSTIVDPELVSTPRDVEVPDFTLVNGEIVRTVRVVQAIDQRPRDGNVKMVERQVPAKDVINYPWDSLVARSPEELLELGLYHVVEIAVPSGKISTGWVIDEVDGVPTQVHILQDIPPPEPVPVPDLTFRQLLWGLLSEGKITEEEALAAATVRTVPAAIQKAFDLLPPEQIPLAKITWATMSRAIRDDALTSLIAMNNEMNPEDTDEFFWKYSQI